MQTSLYIEKEPVKTFTNILQAKRAFVDACLKRNKCVLVNESGMNVQVSVNTPETFVHKTFPNFNAANLFVLDLFRKW